MDLREDLKEELLEKELNRMMTLAEAAEMLGVSKVTLRRWTNGNRLRSYRIGTGRHRRFRKRDLLQFLEGASS